MAGQDQQQPWPRTDEVMRSDLPPGVALVSRLRGHTNWIGRIAWSPDGRTLASPSADMTIRLWDAMTGACRHTLTGHQEAVTCVAFDRSGNTLASGCDDQTVKLWDPADGRLLHTFDGHRRAVTSVAFNPAGRQVVSGSKDRTVKVWDAGNWRLLRTLEGHRDIVLSVAFDPAGAFVASGGSDLTVKLWDPTSGRPLRTLEGHRSHVFCVAIDPTGRMVASGSNDRTIGLWDAASGRLLRTLEGHTGPVQDVHFSQDGGLLASKGGDHTIRVWRVDRGDCIATIPEPASMFWPPGLAFHPHRPLLAAVGSDPDATDGDPGTLKTRRDRLLHVYELDPAVLRGHPETRSVRYTSAKVVLVGDSGVGKTGLGWRLAHGEFKEHASTHGQQFWPLECLRQTRRDGVECEAVLWDLAGQPDYRLVHALFLDDTDLALVLFDPTHDDDPLKGAEFWLKQLGVGGPSSGGPPAVLVAARCDRGSPRLTDDELDAFCRGRGIKAYLPTSALAGDGIESLIAGMKGLVRWEEKSATVTTETFKRVKDLVLRLKERSREVILTPGELRGRLEAAGGTTDFADAEMLTAVGHLANHGYVTCLKTSAGEPRVLLAPELLNNLAASFVLEARRNPKGLGSLDEEKLLTGGYPFPELAEFTGAERSVLLDSAATLFLSHNVCFRETDLLGRAYLVFPELINLKRPVVEDETPVVDGVAYTVAGAVENAYASLVVLMGYTQTFTRTNQWRNHARYEVSRGQVCGFRLEGERAGELDFVLYFGADTPAAIRNLFQCLFEHFLARRHLTVRRFEPAACAAGHVLNRAVVRERTAAGTGFAFCSECGERIALPRIDGPARLTRDQADVADGDRRVADRRTLFEQVLFRLKAYVTEQRRAVPECFVSYAWGNPGHERWVEKTLAADLQKAGVNVVLDRWDNARIGASVPRFVERVGKCDRVIVVGTPLYRKKYENHEPMGAYVVAAEGDLIGARMIGTETEKESVLPALLDGTAKTALPHLLLGRVYADFRDPERYFATALDVLFSLYGIKPQEPVAVELTESLKGRMV